MPKRGEITADPGLAQAKKTSRAFKSLVAHPHGQHGASVREDRYKGHHIVIRTTYEIEIDGQPFPGTLDVSNAGTVQYHGIPNVSSNSAIDLIRSVIDSFPEDFRAGHSHAHTGHPKTMTSRRTSRRTPHAGSPKHSH